MPGIVELSAPIVASPPELPIERLCDLAALPPTSSTVSCLPLRIVGASAAPARAVAIIL